MLFAGDDTTDEDALGRLGQDDVGVKVGLDFTQAQTVVDNRGPLFAPPAGEAGARRFARVMTGLLRTWRRIPFLP